MNTPIFTITIASYNMASTLARAIQSALAQSFGSFEVLVLDDGSIDTTQSVLEEFKTETRVTLLQNETRKGLSAARNFLLREARGEYISILDADDILLPNKLQSHYECFMRSNNLGMVWGKALIKDLVEGSVTELPNPTFELGWDILQDYCAVHSATTWKKEALLSVGGYDPNNTLVEDADMFLKVGDSYSQEYCNELVAIKFRNSKNEFRRPERDRERQALSSKILKETLVRRYPVTSPAQKLAWEFLG